MLVLAIIGAVVAGIAAWALVIEPLFHVCAIRISRRLDGTMSRDYGARISKLTEELKFLDDDNDPTFEGRASRIRELTVAVQAKNYFRCKANSSDAEVLKELSK